MLAINDFSRTDSIEPVARAAGAASYGGWTSATGTVPLSTKTVLSILFDAQAANARGGAWQNGTSVPSDSTIGSGNTGGTGWTAGQTLYMGARNLSSFYWTAGDFGHVMFAASDNTELRRRMERFCRRKGKIGTGA